MNVSTSSGVTARYATSLPPPAPTEDQSATTPPATRSSTSSTTTWRIHPSSKRTSCDETTGRYSKRMTSSGTASGECAGNVLVEPPLHPVSRRRRGRARPLALQIQTLPTECSLAASQLSRGCSACSGKRPAIRDAGQPSPEVSHAASVRCTLPQEAARSPQASIRRIILKSANSRVSNHAPNVANADKSRWKSAVDSGNPMASTRSTLRCLLARVSSQPQTVRTS